MSRAATIGSDYEAIITEATQRFSDHESIDAARILKWMCQFSDAELPLAEKILRKIRYFNANNIRGMTRQLFEMVVDEIGATPRRTRFIPMTKIPGGGADTVARVLRNVRKPFVPNVVSMVDLPAASRNVDTVVFVDDFSGTGDTLVGWWENVEAIVRPLAARVVFASLIMTREAADRAQELGTTVSVEEVGRESNALDRDGGFSASERASILQYCSATGCSSRFVRGYGDSGLLLAFRHACPNNSLPILWYGDKDWHPLFLRRAV